MFRGACREPPRTIPLSIYLTPTVSPIPSARWRAVKEDELARAYRSLEGMYKRVLDDVLWHLDVYFTASESGESEERTEVRNIYNSSRISPRIKPLESLWRKCLREGIASVDQIAEKIEDLIGIRIATANKDQARRLFDYFRAMKDSWFCPVVNEPKFVPYTIPDRNRYSLETGYQAFHVTFILDKGYPPATTVSRWPVEIQCMSQLWEFWTDYSRRYFYGGSDMAARLLPYNVAISKIFDSAEDMMVATTEILLHPESEDASPRDAAREKPAIEIHQIKQWFNDRLAKFFGKQARMPIDLFLLKISEELNVYGITLDRLDSIFQKDENTKHYRAILKASDVAYLPPYQQILCRILIDLGWDDKRIVDRVNEELWLIGRHLVPPQ